MRKAFLPQKSPSSPHQSLLLLLLYQIVVMGLQVEFRDIPQGNILLLKKDEILIYLTMQKIIISKFKSHQKAATCITTRNPK